MRSRLLPALLALCLCLAGCMPTGEGSGPPGGEPSAVGSSGKAVRLEEGEQTALAESAELLTQALARCTNGLDVRPELESYQLTVPSAEEPGAVEQFLYLFTFYQGQEDAKGLYAGGARRDEDGVYHLSEDLAATLLSDLFGVSDWDMTDSNFTYDPAAGEYLSGLEFGTGWGGWTCEEITGVQVDADQGRAVVEYCAVPLFPDASGQPDAVTGWQCRAVYTIGRGEDGRLYLTLEGCTALSPRLR